MLSTARESGKPLLCDGLENLVAGVGLQLAEVTQVPVVQCWDDLGPYLPTYHAISEGEDIQGVGTFLPAKETNREREESCVSRVQGSEREQTAHLVYVKYETRNWTAIITLAWQLSELPISTLPWCWLLSPIVLLLE